MKREKYSDRNGRCIAVSRQSRTVKCFQVFCYLVFLETRPDCMVVLILVVENMPF